MGKNGMGELTELLQPLKLDTGPAGGIMWWWHWVAVTPRWLIPSRLAPSTWQLPRAFACFPERLCTS